MAGELSRWVIFVELISVETWDTLIFKLVLVCMDKIMDNKKIYRRCKETYFKNYGLGMQENFYP
jgi:hypothetical protein